MVRVLRPSMNRGIRIGNIRLSRTAVNRTGGLHGLQSKVEGQETLTVRYLLPFEQPCNMHAAVFLQMQTNGLLYLLPTSTHTNLPTCEGCTQWQRVSRQQSGMPTSVVMMMCMWCAEWRRAGWPQPAWGEEKTRESTREHQVEHM